MDTVEPLKVGVLVLSDRASSGAYEDKSGPAIQEYLESNIENPIEWKKEVIPDDYELIVTALKEMSDKDECSLILTSGGTGPSPRDVSPEATMSVCDKLLPGFGEQMRRVSLQYVPTAILSRQTAGIRGGTLLINLPGKPKAVRECLDAVFAAIPDCVDLIGGPRLQLSDGSKAYRPHGSSH